MNLYTYVNNNPLIFIDPLGLAKRCLTPDEREAIQKSIDLIRSVGYDNEAERLQEVLDANNIRVDTRTNIREGAYVSPLDREKIFIQESIIKSAIDSEYSREATLAPLLAHEAEHHRQLEAKGLVDKIVTTIYWGALRPIAERLARESEDRVRHSLIERRRTNMIKEATEKMNK